MGFEVVEKQNTRKVSIRKDKSIMLPEKTVQAYFEDGEAIRLLFDDENNKMAFESAEPSSRHAYEVPNSDSMEIRGHGVFHTYNVTIEKTQQFLGLWDEDRLIIDLDNPYIVYDSNGSDADANSPEAEADENKTGMDDQPTAPAANRDDAASAED